MKLLQCNFLTGSLYRRTFFPYHVQQKKLILIKFSPMTSNSIQAHAKNLQNLINREFSTQILYSRRDFKEAHLKHSSLLAVQPGISIMYEQKRKLSMSWLDNLAISQTKFFMNLAQSGAVEKLMKSLQVIHDTTNMPWWLTIILSTVFLRTSITFPLAVYQNYIMAKVENIQPEMNELVKRLKGETAVAVKKFNWSEKKTRLMYNRSARRMYKELIIRENCHPFKASILLWGQIPLWILLSISLRNFASMMPYLDANAQIIFLQLSTGGFGWLPNLTIADASLILPVVMGLTNLLIIEVFANSRNTDPTRFQKIFSNAFRVLSVAMIPIAAAMPGCVVLYWTTSSVCGLLQNLVLINPRVRRACGIPITPSEIQNPYTQLGKKLGQKYLFFEKST